MSTSKPPIRPHEISFALGEIHEAVMLDEKNVAHNLVLDLQQRIVELAEREENESAS
jgi:hypothetical protein